MTNLICAHFGPQFSWQFDDAIPATTKSFDHTPTELPRRASLTSYCAWIMLPTRPAIFKHSTDLMWRIFDELQFEDHFQFAYVCKQIAERSAIVIQRRRDGYRKYRVASDLDPATVPALLRSACGIGNPIPAWHVRSIEVWCDRYSFDEWKVFAFKGPNDERPTAQSSRPDQTTRELEAYSEKLDEYVLCEDVMSKTLINAGEDGGLEALLIATLPRLDGVKFVTLQHEHGSTLYRLDRIISGGLEIKGVWVEGFQTLQRYEPAFPHFFKLMHHPRSNVYFWTTAT
ncbi:hypothetical protein DPSP01_008380 [Paraphaeosphaeria sporulosa]